MDKTNVELYQFHNANIHERRLAARVVRVFPLACVLLFVAAIVYGCFKDELLLLELCAVMNVALWLWITTTSLFGMAGSFLVARELKARERATVTDKSPFSTPRNELDSDGVVHMIVYPNYKEEESMLADTLASLAESEDAHNFHVVLAMEGREGDVGQQKAQRLKEKFDNDFAEVTITTHPFDLDQEHLDDSVDPEVPGKASNLKWAVNRSYEHLQKQDPDRLSNVIITIADADCMFHPDYFSAVTKDFNELREKPGTEHQWCMWQAPQLSYRDHWHAPVCSRVWTYVSSMYEFGGVSSLHWGGHHMVFSGYSMPLVLAVNAQSWDGDIIAEDHHAYLKNWLFSLRASAMQCLSEPGAGFWSGGCEPLLQVRPIFLPVKSTPVVSSEGYWQTYIERWHQAKRHAQGLAELPYAMLAMWDVLCTLPVNTYSFSLFYKMARVLMRLLCMHILPICQAAGLATMTVYWFYFDRHLQSCPNNLKFWEALQSEYPLCAFGGAWSLVWPMAIPFICVIIANYMMVSSAFLMPGRNSANQSAWHKEDSGIQARCGSRNFSALVMITIDCALFLSVMMVPYGLVVCLLAMWNVCFSGNRFNYITASKASKDKSAYGTMGALKNV